MAGRPKRAYKEIANGSYVPDISWAAMARINTDKYKEAFKVKQFKPKARK